MMAFSAAGTAAWFDKMEEMRRPVDTGTASTVTPDAPAVAP